VAGFCVGGKQKETELPSGIVAMGARVYDPYTGTFAQPDPIHGGGANAYGYTDGDPVNETDLSGDCIGPLVELLPLCIDLGEDAVAGLVTLFAGTAVISAAEIIHAHQVEDSNVTGWSNGPSGVVNAEGSSGGPTAGKPFSKPVRDGALAGSDTCAYCNGPAQPPEVDHIIPRSRGGNATPENAQVTCRFCNRSKGNRDAPVNKPPGR
jgi:RHS repeat-associated protein